MDLTVAVASARQARETVARIATEMNVETMQDLLGITPSGGNSEVKRGRQSRPKVEQDGDVVVLDEDKPSGTASRSRSPGKKAKKVKEEVSGAGKISKILCWIGTKRSAPYDADRGAENKANSS